MTNTTRKPAAATIPEHSQTYTASLLKSLPWLVKQVFLTNFAKYSNLYLT